MQQEVINLPPVFKNLDLITSKYIIMDFGDAIRALKDGKKVRVAKKSGETIE